MTALTKPIRRVTRKAVNGRSVVVTLAPAGSDNEALIGFHLKGTRTQYVCALSDLYRMAALWHGAKVAKAKAQAKREGVSWRTAKRTFIRNNSIR